jgi:mono/diheme cytochrome c family protein
MREMSMKRMHRKFFKDFFPAGLGLLICMSIPALAQDANLPDGPGKDKVATACSGCHDIGQATGQHLSADRWADIVSVMVNYGAPVTDSDFNTVVKYLAANFGPESPH